jgi:hypothetical protein
MKPMGWKAWYTGGRTFTSEGKDPVQAWADLPKNGVLYVCEFMDELANPYIRYRQMRNGNDNYFMVFRGDEWGIWCNSETDEENVLREPSATHFKRGRWTMDSEMDEVHRAAMDEQWWNDNLPDRPTGPPV